DLRQNHVATGDDRKPHRIGLAVRRAARRPGRAHAAADHVRADHVEAVGVDRLAGAHHAVPPARLARDRVWTGDVLVARQRMKDEDRVGFVRREIAVGLVGDRHPVERLPAVERQRLRQRQAGGRRDESGGHGWAGLVPRQAGCQLSALAAMRPPVNQRAPATKPAMKPWIEAIHAYVPGGSKAADGRVLVKLSANENPLGSSPAALAARAEAVIPALYPDPDSAALREALAEVHGLDPARIVCGTGSGELLTLAASAFAGPGDEVLYVRYGFSLYEIAA